MSLVADLPFMLATTTTRITREGRQTYKSQDQRRTDDVCPTTRTNSLISLREDAVRSPERALASRGSHGDDYLGSPRPRPSLRRQASGHHSPDVFFIPANQLTRHEATPHRLTRQSPAFAEGRSTPSDARDQRSADTTSLPDKRLFFQPRKDQRIRRLSRLSLRTVHSVGSESSAGSSNRRRQRDLLRRKSQDQVLSRQRYLQERATSMHVDVRETSSEDEASYKRVLSPDDP